MKLGFGYLLSGGAAALAGVTLADAVERRTGASDRLFPVIHHLVSGTGKAEAALGTAVLAGVAHACGIVVVMVTYRLIDSRSISRIRNTVLDELEAAGISPIEVISSAYGRPIRDDVDRTWVATEIACIGERDATPPTERHLRLRYQTRQISSGLTVTAILLGAAVEAQLAAPTIAGLLASVAVAAVTVALVLLLRMTANYQEAVRQRTLISSALCAHPPTPPHEARLRRVG